MEADRQARRECLRQGGRQADRWEEGRHAGREAGSLTVNLVPSSGLRSALQSDPLAPAPSVFALHFVVYSQSAMPYCWVCVNISS